MNVITDDQYEELLELVNQFVNPMGLDAKITDILGFRFLDIGDFPYTLIQPDDILYPAIRDVIERGLGG